MKEIIEISEHEKVEDDLDPTLEEICVTNNGKTENNTSKDMSCNLCDFKSHSLLSIKKHMRDGHGIYTGLTSPPLKRKRRKSLN